MGGCYRMVMVNSMGEISECESCFDKDGRRLITVAHGLRDGTPMTMRGVLELGADGKPVAASVHSLYGSEAPFEAMRATYKRKQ